MSPDALPPPRKRRRRPILFGVAGFLIALTAVVLLVLGPAGPWLVGVAAENRQVWRLGRLDLDGVSGAGLGALHADRLRLTDERGVWLEARDITLGWEPLALLTGDLQIETAAAEQIIVFRRPVLSAPEPPSGQGSIDVELEALRIERLEVQEPVAGEAAAFSVDGALAFADDAVQAASLEAIRLDAAEDRLRIVYDADAATKLNARLDGAAEGFFAEALDVAAPVTVVATANGLQTGGAALTATIGDAEAASAELDWTEDAWTARAEADLAAAPAFSTLVRMFGAQVNATASGERPDGDAAPFRAQVDSENLELVAEGFLGANYQPRGDVSVEAAVAQLERVTEAVNGGAARFDGTVMLASGVTRAQGRLDATRVQAAGVTASYVGPVDVRINSREVAVAADGDIGQAVAPEIVADLARGGALSLRATYERAEQRLEIERLAIESDVATVTGQGVFGGGETALSGRWRVTRLAAVDPRIAGAAAGPWSVQRSAEGAPLRILASGEASRFSTTLPALADLLGPTPDFSARLATTEGGLIVDRFLAEGRQLRAGATGRIVDERLALRLEASARGPVGVGPVEFSGVADATGTVSGPLEALAVEAQAQMAQVEIGTLRIDRPILDISLLPTGGGAREGRVALAGEIAGEPSTASARLAATEDVFALEDLRIQGAGLEAAGRAAFAEAGPTVDLAVQGNVAQVAPVTGDLQAALSVRPGPGDAPLVIDAEGVLTDGRFRDLRIASLGFDAQGPLDALRVAAGLRGRGSGMDIALDAQGLVSQTDDALTADARLSGSLNGFDIVTLEPIEVRVADGVTAASGALGIGQGSAQAAVTLGETLQASARLQDTPLAPLLAFIGERAAGTATGTLTMTGGGSTLRGQADLALDDALIARRMREPLDVRLTATLDDTTLAAQAQAISASGLDASIEGRAPVAASASPLRIALNGQGQAQWRARGPAGALWGLVGTLDQRVTGTVDGAGSVRFSVGELSGDGYFTLADGTFSDRLSGVNLRDIDARVVFVNDGARLERFSARDRNGGTLTGTGVAEGVGRGRITLAAGNIRLLDRQDAQATASGPIELVWQPEGARLTGDLRIDRAELEPPSGGTGDIPQLDVVEINVPPRLAALRAETEPAQQDEDARPVYPVALQVRVRAPGQVFLRGRGLDTEWSVNLTATGTVSDPQLVGEARFIRGSFNLASRQFDIDEGLVRFSGDPLDAQLDLVAVRETPDLTARVAVTGTVTDPELEFSSTPALPEDEILPQILFGRSIEDLSGLEAAQLAAGLSQLAGRSTFDLAGAARTLVGLDRIDVRETDDGLRVAGGKYLTRDVYLEVARTGLGETETAIEWRVRPRLYVISAFAPEGDRRLSVRWRREY